MRMFVAVRPPLEVRDALAEFLEARPGIGWTSPEHWHLTLAFFAKTPDHRLDELTERLAVAAFRVEPFMLRLSGAGAFPDASRAAVLWLGVDDDARTPLQRLARGARSAANRSGAVVDGKAFNPHLTLARPRRHEDATRWLRILETFRSDPWEVESVELVESFLGEGPRGRARHEVVAELPLGGGSGDVGMEGRGWEGRGRGGRGRGDDGGVEDVWVL